jgi:uncharacterized membrane protein YidH (DUF202 family)
MYSFLTKHGTMLAFGLGLFLSVVALVIVSSGLDTFAELQAADKEGETTIFNFFIYSAIVLVILCALLMLGFGILHVATDFMGAIEFIGGLVVIIGLIVVFYATSSPETSGSVYQAIEEGELTATTSRWISGAIWTTLILLGVATLAFIFSEIRNIFK